MNRLLKISAMAFVIVALLALGFGVFQNQSSSAVMAQSGEALVWQVGGEPGTPQGLGTMFWHSGGGADPTKLADVPDEGGGTIVQPCGADAYAVDDFMMAYIGNETGGLYQIPLTGNDELVRFADAHQLACSGNGYASYSPDRLRWAYINFPEAITRQSEFAYGELRLLDIPGGDEVTSIDDVLAFDVRNDGLFYVQFFTNAEGHADEAVVTYWQDNGRSEWADLAPAEDCRWTSAAIDSREDGRAAVLSLGESCPDEGSQWRLFSILEDGTVNEHVYMRSGGRYLPHAYDNQVYYLDDPNLVLATFPNGRAGNIVNLVLVTLDTNTATLITEGATTDVFPGGKAMQLQFSPDEDTLLYTSSTANSEEFLHRLSLDGSVEPLTIPAGPRGDAIAAIGFHPNNDALYVAGGVDGGDNSLYLLPNNATEADRVTRGQFLRDSMVVTADTILLLDFVDPDDDYRQNAANLVWVELNGNMGELVEGRTAEAVAYPLAWR